MALIAKVFFLVENLLRGGLEPTPVSYPWYDTRRPYQLSHSCLPLSIILAIIFGIFEHFFKLLNLDSQTRTGFDGFESKWEHFGKHLS